MDHKNEEKVQKYTLLYMSLGMCFGSAIGSAKDKRLSEKMMKIVRIETIPDASDVIISAVDKNGNEKAYKTFEEKLKAEKFSVGNRVAEDGDGSLISLES